MQSLGLSPSLKTALLPQDSTKELVPKIIAFLFLSYNSQAESVVTAETQGQFGI
jgi:hypothetical protein